MGLHTQELLLLFFFTYIFDIVQLPVQHCQRLQIIRDLSTEGKLTQMADMRVAASCARNILLGGIFA